MSQYVRLAVPLDIVGIQGLKMTPQAKPGTAAGRLQSTQSFSAPSQRKKMSSAGFSDKSGKRSSNRLKRKYSKSASGGNRNSAGKSAYGFLTSTHIASRERPQNHVTISDELKRPGSGIVALTAVNLKHSEFGKLPEFDPDQEANPEKTNLDKLKMSLSSELSNQVASSNEGDATQFGQGKKRDNISDKQKGSDLIEIEHLLMKCRGTPNGITDSDDEEDYVFPNLLGYDFHAIYKKDGLQFDENWQDRMLDRYMLMKLQKQQRQESAMSKRVFLEQEKRLRFIATQPDLAEKLEQPWYEDHEALVKFILNNSLISGDSPKAPDNLPSYSTSSSRPLSSASNIRKSVVDESPEKDGKFRFSIRPKSSHQAYERDTTSNDPLSPRAASVKSSRVSRSKSVGNVTAERLLVQRPRSSTSIPGKTRYILVKPEKDRKRTNVRNPTKLEEQLMLKRFPSQHSNVMKSLGRNDKSETPEMSDDEFQEISFNEVRASPVSPQLSRKSQIICDASFEAVQRNSSPGCLSTEALRSLQQFLSNNRRISSFSALYHINFNSEMRDDVSTLLALCLYVNLP